MINLFSCYLLKGWDIIQLKGIYKKNTVYILDVYWYIITMNNMVNIWIWMLIALFMRKSQQWEGEVGALQLWAGDGHQVIPKTQSGICLRDSVTEWVPLGHSLWSKEYFNSDVLVCGTSLCLVLLPHIGPGGIAQYPPGTPPHGHWRSCRQFRGQPKQNPSFWGNRT